MKLHIGAGEKYLSGYRHMDVIKRDHIDYVGNAEEIYACRILEHFKRDEVEDVLLEWNRVRVLTKSCRGVLRVAVPDFNAVAKGYTQNGDLKKVMDLFIWATRLSVQHPLHYIRL